VSGVLAVGVHHVLVVHAVGMAGVGIRCMRDDGPAAGSPWRVLPGGRSVVVVVVH